jgi:hypothetical protein
MEVTQGIYEHYKSTSQLRRFYQVLLLSHLEETGEPLVHYQPLYYEEAADNTIYDDGITVWTRTLESFCEDVEWQGRTVPRFKRRH